MKGVKLTKKIRHILALALFCGLTLNVWPDLSAKAAESADLSADEITVPTGSAKSLKSDEIAVALTPSGADYDGREHQVKVTVTDGDKELTQGADYEVEPSVPAFSEEGSYTIQITGKGNYRDQVSAVFLIEMGAAGEGSVIVEGASYVPGYYSGPVTVKPGISGWSIGESKTGPFFDRLIYDSGLADDTMIYLKDGDERIKQYILKKFEVDTTAPSVDESTDLEVSDAGRWANSKTVTITVPSDAYEVYYSVTASGPDTVSAGQDLSGLTGIPVNNGQGSFSITEAGTYYIFVIDRAGNVGKTEITVEQIDGAAPQFLGLEDQGSYYLTNSNTAVEFSVSDEGGSGIAKVSLIEISDGSLGETELFPDDGKYLLTVSGSYQVRAADRAGNETSVSIDIKKDTKAPEIALGAAVNDAGYTAETEEGCYLFKEGLKVTLDIADNPGAGETADDQAPVMVVRTGADGTWDKEIVPEQGPVYTDMLTEGGTYIYSVSDGAGNFGSSVTVKAEKSKKTGLKGNIAYTAEPKTFTDGTGKSVKCFNRTTKPAFSADFGADEHIVKIEFSSDGIHYNSIPLWSQVDGAGRCTLGTALSHETLTVDGQTDLELADGSYSYAIKATDAAGIYKEYKFDFKVDREAPDSAVYVIYEPDIGAGRTTAGELGNTGLGRLYGQRYVKFYLLIKDAAPSGISDPYISGIDGDNLKECVVLPDRRIRIEGLELLEGTRAQEVIGESAYDGYAVIKGTLKAPDHSSVSGKLRVTGLKDRAGNLMGGTAAPVELDGDTVIFLDTCPPKLGINYGAGGSYTEKAKDGTPYINYRDSAVLKLTLDEAFYDRQTADGVAVQPEVVVTRVTDGAAETIDSFSWTAVTGQTYEAELRLKLDKIDGKEALYSFTVSYADGSQNALTADEDCKGSTSGSVFTSRSIVIDNKAPKITDVRIVDDEADLRPEKEAVLTGNDVRITAVVKDTYLDTVKLLKDGRDSGIRPDAGYPDADGRYFWTISTDTYIKGEYQVTAADMAGNKGEESRKLSVEIVRTAPEITDVGSSTKDWAAAHGGWSNKDTVFTVRVKNSYGSSAIPKVRYRKTGSSSVYEMEEGMQGQEGLWSFAVEESDDTFDGSYEFQAYDELGNGKSENGSWTKLLFRKDKVLPDIDTIRAEYIDYEEETNKVPQGIFARALDMLRETEFGEKLYERIFVKNKIQATLYLQDRISGVKLITYQYGGKTYPPVQVSGTTADGKYQAARFELEGENADTLKIIAIEDEAGNVADGSTKPELAVKGQGTQLLVIDHTAPSLHIVYESCTGKEDSGQRRYYRPEEGQLYEKVTLTFTEQYFDKNVDMETGKVILPIITVYKDGAGAEGNITEYLAEGSSFSFRQWNRSDGTISAELWLPYMQEDGGSETEYRITASYQDGSGNLLTLADAADSFGILETDTGTYRSGIIILDNQAPKLTGCRTVGTTDRMVNNVEVYHNVEGADVNISFTIDDNGEYWDAASVNVSVAEVSSNRIIVSNHPDIQGGSAIEGIHWTDDGNFHTASFGFDGETGAEADYAVRISYEDRAGNLLVNGGADGILEDGSYTGRAFILDHAAPVFHISFNKAFRLKDGDNKDYSSKNKTPEVNMTSYYGRAEGSIDITVTVDEAYLAKDEEKANRLADFEFLINGTDAAMDWKKSGTRFRGTYSVTEDGDYKISVACRDAAGNRMQGGGAVQGGRVSQGRYQSPLLILDTAAPVVTYKYTSSPVNENNGRKYFGENTTLKIQVEDQNIRYMELKDSLKKMEAEDIQTKRIKNTNAWTAINGISEYGIKRGIWNVDIPLSTDANYRIPISFTDLAGNAADLNVTELPTKDTTLPADLEFSYSVNDPVNYKGFGYLFARHKMSVTASAKDETAGIRKIRFTITDENGRKTVKEKTFSAARSNSYKVEIPLEVSDFKGTVKTEVFDWSGNRLQQTRSHVVESAEKHDRTGGAVIKTQTSPSRTIGDRDFYNTDVKLNLTIRDAYSGIGFYSYKAGSNSTVSRDFRKQAGTALTKDGQKTKITETVSQDLILTASSNNENGVMVFADYTDNAGHTGHVDQLYNVDITAPEITVEYDLNAPSNERFYHQARTATITIRERNFSADDVKFIITNTDGAMPAISGWSSSGTGDDTRNTCSVVFSADGDYSFTVAFEDMAGNRAEYSRLDEFTIDQTRPEMTVSYDNNDSKNERYYNRSRTATIDILEHNFDPSLIHVAAAADGTTAPFVSGWGQNGDHHTATVTFGADGEYIFNLSGTDQADNPLDEYETDRFIVDQTPPELEIFNITDLSANNGTVTPGIRYSDLNYDADNSVILMKGYHNGEQEINQTPKATANGMEIRLDDFAYTPETDDIYTMKATVYDLAGNSSEAEVTFSVNRFGSVYAFDERTARLVGDQGKYYTNEEQDIVVTETNVDTLEFREITCNLNGSLQTMEEDRDYSVNESGTEKSWKQYTYTIKKSNFEKEGTYVLTIYSEDRAMNVSDNSTKGKKVEFAVDKTSPSILISGVENNRQYRENSREIMLDVQDNICLSEVEVNVDGKKSTFSASQVDRLEGKIVFTADSAPRWQTLKVTAYDAAGNEKSSEEIRFLITSNIFVQFFMNKGLFYGTVTALAFFLTGIWQLAVLFRKKKRTYAEP